MDGWMIALSIFVVLILLGMAVNAWKMLKRSEEMIKRIDKSKLNDLSDDDWK
jgi:high-affinity Fe2+/Pb2+ permease